MYYFVSSALLQQTEIVHGFKPGMALNTCCLCCVCQACRIATGVGQAGPQVPPDVRGRVEAARRAAVSRMGALYDSRTWSVSPVQYDLHGSRQCSEAAWLISYIRI